MMEVWKGNYVAELYKLNKDIKHYSERFEKLTLYLRSEDAEKIRYAPTIFLRKIYVDKKPFDVNLCLKYVPMKIIDFHSLIFRILEKRNRALANIKSFDFPVFASDNTIEAIERKIGRSISLPSLIQLSTYGLFD